jgi:hypothetical protein
MVALDVSKLSADERAMTVEAYLKGECKKRTAQLVRHMDGHIEAFELSAKRARAQLEEAAAAAAAARAAGDERDEDALVDVEEETDEVYCLQGIVGPYQGHTFWMPAAPNTTTRLVLGRSSSCDIPLDKDDEVSSKHARVDVRNSSFKLVDTNSTNGTFVNVEKLGRKAHSLRPGDTVTLGASTFKWALVQRPAEASK